ncbi:MAG: hypothetical protein BWY04_00301 [candidate division CPR1 bacterium ADurb.Bin160]|uniref:Uncharacterized protein n=1 Tax=candidate division CPR1 bacterium ADurb.Bin160 TaxID=1852826 RepID=A0A1V5ZPZ3_9BACT|nr:MAG: hypothetical protein BWY04_00301 [candidate division CPR1 bacterium ADurb.Bin160]
MVFIKFHSPSRVKQKFFFLHRDHNSFKCSCISLLSSPSCISLCISCIIFNHTFNCIKVCSKPSLLKGNCSINSLSFNAILTFSMDEIISFSLPSKTFFTKSCIFHIL